MGFNQCELSKANSTEKTIVLNVIQFPENGMKYFYNGKISMT